MRLLDPNLEAGTRDSEHWDSEYTVHDPERGTASIAEMHALPGRLASRLRDSPHSAWSTSETRPDAAH
jgi:hypothetical protein